MAAGPGTARPHYPPPPRATRCQQKAPPAPTALWQSHSGACRFREHPSRWVRWTVTVAEPQREGPAAGLPASWHRLLARQVGSPPKPKGGCPAGNLPMPNPVLCRVQQSQSHQGRAPRSARELEQAVSGAGTRGQSWHRRRLSEPRRQRQGRDSQTGQSRLQLTMRWTRQSWTRRLPSWRSLQSWRRAPEAAWSRLERSRLERPRAPLPLRCRSRQTLPPHRSGRDPLPARASRSRACHRRLCRRSRHVRAPYRPVDRRQQRPSVPACSPRPPARFHRG